jgi:diguanylate cyclase (GGDEF)-like protein
MPTSGLKTITAGLVVVAHAAGFACLAGVASQPVLFLAAGLVVGFHAHRLGAARTELRALGDVVRAAQTQRESLVDELETLSRTDALTGLGNRRELEFALPRLLAHAEASLSSVAVAVIDLDDFKTFNDANGHLAGDRLLKEAAAAWQGQLRGDDVLIRLGGDEFVALLPGCSLANAERIAARLGEALGDAGACSVGVASWDGYEPAERLLGRADAAMYDAKRATAGARSLV